MKRATLTGFHDYLKSRAIELPKDPAGRLKLYRNYLVNVVRKKALPVDHPLHSIRELGEK